MKCEEFREHLSAFLDGEVAAELGRAMTAHTAACDRCRREMEWMVRSTEVVATGLPVLEPPPRLWAAIVREIQPAPRPSFWESLFAGRRAVFAGAAAACVVLAALGTGVWWLTRNPFDERMFQHELSAYMQQRQAVVGRGNPFLSQELKTRPGEEKPENPFSGYLRPAASNPFKEAE
jgi:anti-sigma factor RsiW